ncbi:MAG: shikimate dehydrogenase, partial [Clostridiales bacterium]|nr:shikimate dehydrogenase [Clostridiales bacterium]
FRHYGVNSAFFTINLRKGELPKFFEDYVKTFSLDGFTTTMPQKEDVIPYMDDMSEAARICKSVNVVSIKNGKCFGHTTDGLGFANSLEAAGLPVSQQKIVIYGCGGATKSITYALKSRGGDVRILSRDIKKAEDTAKALGGGIKVGSSDDVKEYLSDCTLFVNASPLGMKGNAMFQDFSFLDCLPKNATVYDIIYNPMETELRRQAKIRSLHTIGGIKMLLAQMSVIFELLTGIRPDDKAMDMVFEKVEAAIAKG